MLTCLAISDSLQLQTPLSMGFPRQEYWSELPFLPPGDVPDSGIEPTYPVSPAMAGGLSTTEPPGKPVYIQLKMLEPSCHLSLQNSPGEVATPCSRGYPSFPPFLLLLKVQLQVLSPQSSSLQPLPACTCSDLTIPFCHVTPHVQA